MKTMYMLAAVMTVALLLSPSFTSAAPCNETLQYDDGTADEGYTMLTVSANPSSFAMKFVPCGLPYKFSKFTIALSRHSSGAETANFTITMWKNNGGLPGDSMAATSATAAALPVVPSYTWYNFTLPDTWATVPATDSSVFLGIQLDPAAWQQSIYVGADQSVTTTLWPGYSQIGTGAWTALEVGYVPLYRALLMRAEGGSCGTYYRDADADGYGDAAITTQGCSMTPPAGYVDNSSGFDVNDADPFLTDVWPSCDIKVIPRALGWLLGEREADRLVLIVGQRGVDFDEATAVKWESPFITAEIEKVFFKRLMLMKLTIAGDQIDKGAYRVLVGNCIGTLRLAR